ETNGLQRGAPLRPGQRIRIPTAFLYRIRRGDTLEGLTQRFLEDRRRTALLGALNNLRATEHLHEGQELLIPFQHVHRSEAPESLQSVARAFYGDASKARMLAEYNFRSAPMLAKGDRLLVPIAHVRIRSVKLESPPLMTEKPAAPMDHSAAII